MNDNAPAAERQISSLRMLEGIRRTLSGFDTTQLPEQIRGELGGIQAALAELIMRERGSDYAEYLRTMRSLAETAAALHGARTSVQVGNDNAGRSGFAALGAEINQAGVSLSSLVKTLDAGDPSHAAILKRVTEAEHRLNQRRAEIMGEQGSASGQPAITVERLTAYLARRFPGRPGIRVTGFRELPGGFQKTTILFRMADDTGREESLVMRADKDVDFLQLELSDVAKEYELVRYLHAKGFPVAEPLWVETDRDALGRRFMVSREVTGKVCGSAVAANELMTDAVAQAFIEEVARLHMLPVDAAMRALPVGHWAGHATPRDNARANVASLIAQPWMRSCNPSPLMERIVKWLHENAPQEDFAHCLTHCDYGPHNGLVADNRIAAILDWETARIGDPAEDIGCFLQSCGRVIDEQRILTWYQDATGNRISEYRLRYYDVVSCLKVLMVCLSAEAMYEHLPDAPMMLCQASLLIGGLTTGRLEEKIALAEAVRGR